MNTELTLGGLFEGIGGFPLAAQWAGIKPVWSNEIDPYACKVLRKNFKHEIIEDDIKNLGRHNLKPVDIISGGFPCQPFSTAGKRRGKEDNRYLWPQMFRIIQELKPTYVIGENVPGIVTMEDGETLKRIFADLESEGYTVETFIIPACGIKAWHRRDRIWIVSYRDNSNTPRTNTTGSGLHRPEEQQQGETELRHEQKRDSKRLGKDVPNPDSKGLQRSRYELREQKAKSKSGTKFSSGWATEPELGGGFNGFPDWLHRHNIKGYGQKESFRRTEILRELWNKDVSKTIWQVIGGFDQIQKSEVLFSIVCEYEVNINKARVLMESQKALKEYVRGLWMQGKITGSSYRPKDGKQLRGEYPDPMQELSRLLAYAGEENWQISSWEDGIPRVTSNIPNRVDRIKGLGNSIVPQIAYEIFMLIKQISK